MAMFLNIPWALLCAEIYRGFFPPLLIWFYLDLFLVLVPNTILCDFHVCAYKQFVISSILLTPLSNQISVSVCTTLLENWKPVVLIASQHDPISLH